MCEEVDIISHDFTMQGIKNTVYVIFTHCLCTVYALFTGSTILFTHLKIILLQYFQFSVSAKISSIQTDPKNHNKNNLKH